RRAHRTWPRALRAKHIAIDDERLLVAEKAGEIDRPVFALKPVAGAALAAGRQRTALNGPPFDVPAQLDFLGEQRIARAAVVVAFVRERDAVALHQLDGGNEGWNVGHA